ncbi:hypothetical protein BU14_1894s0001 [Porphyra umbilicalis]|uniref:Uncharacterized protein n=1 Tax=Porphyra umbilicalis TaxID=2786 RepID=A0A1X6NKL9_PORUM|nr:hypothetical protein BU14_1894s0001 [Porphyra umbilicalis]|eukprot:OSX69080.1 hypothetical protein BU14_1894s0001 [Porphyra umbilicalis]
MATAAPRRTRARATVAAAAGTRQRRPPPNLRAAPVASLGRTRPPRPAAAASTATCPLAGTLTWSTTMAPRTSLPTWRSRPTSRPRRWTPRCGCWKCIMRGWPCARRTRRLCCNGGCWTLRRSAIWRRTSQRPSATWCPASKCLRASTRRRSRRRWRRRRSRSTASPRALRS